MEYLEILQKGNFLKESQVKILTNKVKEIFKNEDNII